MEDEEDEASKPSFNCEPKSAMLPQTMTSKVVN